jgi:general secretion pathway protein C
MPEFALTPRQARLALDLLTGLVIVSVAFALAGLTWRLAGHAGSGAVTVPSGAAAVAAAPDIAPALALAPFGRAAAGEGAQPTTLPHELKGVIAASPRSFPPPSSRSAGRRPRRSASARRSAAGASRRSCATAC